MDDNELVSPEGLLDGSFLDLVSFDRVNQLDFPLSGGDITGTVRLRTTGTGSKATFEGVRSTFGC